MSSEENSVNSRYDGANLSELFDSAFQLFNEISNTSEPSNSSKVQADVRKAMRMFEDATKLVSLVDMFSANESYEEVSTENLKYFLLPALLGTLATKLCNIEDRMQVVDIAEIYFVDYLKRLKDYGLIDIDIPEVKTEESSQQVATVEHEKSNAELITEMVNKRNTKIQRYKEQKELEQRLQTLKQSMENPNIGDEEKREYFITLLKMYVSLAVDELGSLASEKPMLRHMQMLKSNEGESPKARKPKIQAPPLKPIIITRDSVQKAVYGAGYPSLPVLTVEEFYEKKIRDGEWPDPSKAQPNSKSLQNMTDQEKKRQEEMEDEEKELREENDDPELLARARAMDEYKDTHRRGWGNRANRS